MWKVTKCVVWELTTEEREDAIKNNYYRYLENNVDKLRREDIKIISGHTEANVDRDEICI